MTMNPEIKARWVARLRTPDLPQTKGVLDRAVEYVTTTGRVDPVGQCCLGVLCSLAAEEGIIEQVAEPDERGARGFLTEVDDHEGGTELYTEHGVLPREVQRWAGLTGYDADNPRVRDQDNLDRPLATLNDRGYTFTQLAELIDQSL